MKQSQCYSDAYKIIPCTRPKANGFYNGLAGGLLSHFVEQYHSSCSSAEVYRKVESATLLQSDPKNQGRTNATIALLRLTRSTMGGCCRSNDVYELFFEPPRMVIREEQRASDGSAFGRPGQAVLYYQTIDSDAGRACRLQLRGYLHFPFCASLFVLFP
jgi:hypothetical protein